MQIFHVKILAHSCSLPFHSYHSLHKYATISFAAMCTYFYPKKIDLIYSALCGALNGGVGVNEGAIEEQTGHALCGLLCLFNSLLKTPRGESGGCRGKIKFK